MSEVADTRRLNSKPQDLVDAYGPPSNFLEIDVNEPQIVGVGRNRYTVYKVRMKVSFKKHVVVPLAFHSQANSSGCGFARRLACLAAKAVCVHALSRAVSPSRWRFSKKSRSRTRQRPRLRSDRGQYT